MSAPHPAEPKGSVPTGTVLIRSSSRAPAPWPRPRCRKLLGPYPQLSFRPHAPGGGGEVAGGITAVLGVGAGADTLKPRVSPAQCHATLPKGFPPRGGALPGTHL